MGWEFALALGVLGVVTGAVLASWLWRSRLQAERELGAFGVRAELDSAQAVARERAQTQERLDLERQQALEVARASLERLQSELGASLAQVAALQAKAEQLPAVEAELSQLREQHHALQQEHGDVREAQAHLRSKLELTTQALDEQRARVVAQQDELKGLQEHAAQLRSEVEGLRQSLQAEREKVQERGALIEQARDQFKVLAGEILETNSKQLQSHNQTSLSTLLDPLRQRLVDFQKKVEDVYVDESKERSALRQQVESLMQLNQSLSAEARSLTSALRGSVKSQGNWGELILERVLEASGLRSGQEYLVQDSQTNEAGQRLQPDVVILLPEGRRLVVDSKLSLLAYERYATGPDEAERDGALKDHLSSVRAHMRGLSDKRYQNLYGQSLDFVLMFIPIEPAFMAAVTQDAQLFMDAWERNVLLVSPSTLLFVVRTVAHLWRQEAQNRNAQEIAKRGAELYDKLSGFAVELEAVGSKLESAQQSYLEARKRLASGRGNVIRQAQMLKELGVKPSKDLPSKLSELADLSSEQDEAASLLQAGVSADEGMGQQPPLLD